MIDAREKKIKKLSKQIVKLMELELDCRKTVSFFRDKANKKEEERKELESQRKELRQEIEAEAMAFPGDVNL